MFGNRHDCVFVCLCIYLFVARLLLVGARTETIWTGADVDLDFVVSVSAFGVPLRPDSPGATLKPSQRASPQCSNNDSGSRFRTCI